jgi:acyl carrier protein
VSNSSVVKQYIVHEFLPDVAAEDLADDYDLIASGVVDSLSLLRLIDWLQSEFEIPIDDIEISEKDFVTVAAICEFIARETRPRESAPEPGLERLGEFS